MSADVVEGTELDGDLGLVRRGKGFFSEQGIGVEGFGNLARGNNST